MIKWIKENFLLIIILIIGFLCRFVLLTDAPPGLNADEAALGYNAYSLLQTGKDEWGESWPIVFKSFSDYKPGLYVYLAIPFIAIFGLNETAVRLPSVILGTLTILVVFLLAKEIYPKKLYAFIAALMMALSPWSIHFSRGAWETNVATFFISLGFLAFIKGFNNGKWWTVSGLSFVASMYAYQSPRLIVPLFALCLAIIYWKKLLNKQVFIAFVITAIVAIPLALTLFDNRGLARFNGVSIFSDIGPSLQTNVARGNHEDLNSSVAKFFHNKIIAYSLNFSKHYLDHFSPNFLFITGDPLGRNLVPEMGQLYIFEIVTLLLGVYVLIQDPKVRFKKVILIWVLIAPIAASLTYQTPHALRALSMVVPLTLISALGLTFLFVNLLSWRNFLKIPVLVISLCMITFFVARFFDLYFIHLPKQNALEWQYGFSQVVPYVMENKDKYSQVIITDRYDQPYILFLFYSKYDPAKYQSVNKKEVDNNFGFTTVQGFDNFEFKRIFDHDVENKKNVILVGSKDELYKYEDRTKKINFPNGEAAFRIIELP